MRKNEFESYIKNSNFYGLFNELGWDNTNVGELSFTIDDNEFAFKPVVEKRGFLVYTCYVEEIPKNAFCKRIDTKLKKYSNDYILIFIDSKNPLHHQWTVPVKNVDKRNIVNVEYGCIEQTGFLYSKVDDFFFDIEEETNITDVTKRVHAAFDVNSEKVTKDFYAGFKKQHDAFANFVSGISVEGDKQWYVSVMLNRLMFCYFIQKKNFLDFNPNYLREKLNWSKEQKGKDKFFKGFYKNFLIELFEGGLNNPEHNTKEFKEVYGKIPYLNGGMFDKHQIEKAYENIDIEDEAFENLFDFFDKYRWHLDTRIEASGKDINPDVLGYIFEQYINDRATKGAYYTKEDITNYIGRNCIIPYLFEKTKETNGIAFEKNGLIWEYLKNSGTKYIYSSVLKGWSKDWKKLIPDEIAKGLKEYNSSAEKKVSEDDTLETLELIRNRKEWNKNTDDVFGLPTEIWRETIERLERCDSLVSKIEAGEICEINDFITYNLDIVSFVNDLLVNCDDLSFVKNFYTALTNVTILDPTCGSGAFLFAALNILEPLYDVCLDKMEELGDISENEKIKKQYRSNREYFIYKTIILHNLYGVDIMNEATEIAKLRLFLKMVAVVEADRKQENLGLDPLPDIDFNIRCGNTLVGYSNKEEVNNSIAIGDMFARAEYEEKVNTELQIVSETYKNFISLQKKEADFLAMKKAKVELNTSLQSLNTLLNHHMYCSEKGILFNDDLNSGENEEYLEWIRKTTPFHWISEFYEIIDNGGFDIIIGNPPYISLDKINYQIKNSNFECSDLYGYVIKRVISILHNNGRHGFIVMHNLAFSRNFKDVRKLLVTNNSSCWFSFYSRIPSGLFDGTVRVRNAIYLFSKKGNKKYTTRMHRWFSPQRPFIFSNLVYNSFSCKSDSIIPMLNNEKLQEIFEREEGIPLKNLETRTGKPLFYKKVAYNWLSISDIEPPCFDKDNNQIPQSELGQLLVNEDYYKLFLLLVSGKLYFSKWLTYGDDFHLTSKDILGYKYPFDKITEEDKNELSNIYNLFISSLEATVQFKLNAGKRVGTFNTRKLWHITDQSDLIFLKYISNDSLEIYEMLERQISCCVISDKSNEEIEDEI